MKRKLVQHGPTTLITSLPSKWVEKYSLKKGDEINIEEKGPILEISTEKSMAVRAQKIDIRHLSESLVWRYLLSLYRYGIDEIIVTHENQFDLLQKITDQLIGFGIVKQENKVVTIKDLSGVSETDFSQVYRRCFFLLLDMAEQSHALHKKKQSLEPIIQMDRNMNKYVDYCLRVLNKRGFTDPRKTSLYYHTITQLEYLGDLYSLIAKKKSKDLDDLKEINSLLRAFYELCFEYSDQKAQSIFLQRVKLEKSVKNPQMMEIVYTIINLVDSQYAVSLEGV